MRWGAVTVTIIAVSAPSSHALAIDDAEALALVQKHCVMCHATKPTHESFQEAPKYIALETIADIRKHAATISAQTVQTKAMPLGNQTGMTDEERATLAQMAEESAVSDDTRPWGFFVTFVLGAIALLAGQLAGMAALVGWYGFDLRNVPVLSQHGGAIILFIFVSAPVQVAILALAAGHKGNIADYLGYKLPRRGEVVLCLAILAAMIAIGDAMSWLAGRSVVDRFQTDIYQAANSVGQLPLLLAAVVVLIPIGEETLFRGFLMRGWLRSPRSVWPIILVTAALFAIIHVQYDWFLIGQVFAFGVLFGWARWATGSTLLTMMLHAVVNLEGMLETFLSLNS